MEFKNYPSKHFLISFLKVSHWSTLVCVQIFYFNFCSSILDGILSLYERATKSQRYCDILQAIDNPHVFIDVSQQGQSSDWTGKTFQNSSSLLPSSLGACLPASPASLLTHLCVSFHLLFSNWVKLAFLHTQSWCCFCSSAWFHQLE